MAQLSPETKAILQNLMENLLEIINEAKRSEFLLLETFGETSETENPLNELTEIAQQASDLYNQIIILRIRIAEAQPVLSTDMLRLLTQRINTISNRNPALVRSINEIKLDWGLS